MLQLENDDGLLLTVYEKCSVSVINRFNLISLNDLLVNLHVLISLQLKYLNKMQHFHLHL